MRKIKNIIIMCVLFVIISLFAVQNTGVFAKTADIELTARSYVVVDENNKILLNKDASSKREVASICKLMTTLITLEKIDEGAIDIDTKFIVSKHASDVEGSQAFLDAGSEYSVDELLKSVIIASANDSAIVLAEGIAGSELNFVKMMNDKAKEIGMHDTRYANATGLPAMEQYSTAYDTAVILNLVSDYSIYQKYCQIWMDELIHPSGRKTELVNTNRLIKYYDYCTTGKTGFTDEAGYCLASICDKNNFKLTCVVLGANSSANRFTESINLLNFAFANFKNVKIIEKGQVFDNDINIIGGKNKTIELNACNDFYWTIGVDEDANYEVLIEVPDEVKAPVFKDDIIGVANIVVDGNVVGSVDLCAIDGVEKQSFHDIFNKILDNFDLF